MHDDLDPAKGMTGPAPRDDRRLEVWMRGPLPGVPPLLQPVAHSLSECLEEVQMKAADATPAELWTEYGGAASAGFHLRHAAGSLDRLFTYARGERLSADQLRRLGAEREPDLAPGAAQRLIDAFAAQVDRSLAQVRGTDETTLLEGRAIGRAQLPSTVIGLLFHGAEHTQRHIGQFETPLRLLRVFSRDAPPRSS